MKITGHPAKARFVLEMSEDEFAALMVAAIAGLDLVNPHRESAAFRSVISAHADAMNAFQEVTGRHLPIFTDLFGVKRTVT